MINSGIARKRNEFGPGYSPMFVVRYYQGRRFEVRSEIHRVPFSPERFRVVEAWVPRSDGMWYDAFGYIRSL